MLINLSNHPFNSWPENQKKAALKEYFEAQDVPFPVIDPEEETSQISELARKYTGRCLGILGQNGIDRSVAAVHIMGELTFCFALVAMLQKQGIRCIASTTRRIVEQSGNAKTSEFGFVRFRDYPQLIGS